MSKTKILKHSYSGDRQQDRSTRQIVEPYVSASVARGLVVLGLLSALGCADDGAETVVEEAPPVCDDDRYTDTMVTLHADGSLEQTTRVVSAAQRQQERESRVGSESDQTQRGLVGQKSLTKNTTCANSDLWIYDATFTRRLCISGAHLGTNQHDTLDLRSVTFGRCFAIDVYGGCVQRETWAGKASYVYPGVNVGRIFGDESVGITGFFDAWGPLQSVDPAQTLVIALYGPYLG